MQFRAVVYFLSFIISAFQSQAFLQNDLDQFLVSLNCEHCDLTRSVLKFKSSTLNLGNTLNVKKSFLTNAKIQASEFYNTNISESNAIRILIANSNFNQSFLSDLLLTYSMIENVSFKDSKIINSHWDRSQLIDTVFENCIFESLSFQGSDLRSSKLTHNTFLNTNFSQSDLRGVDFQHSYFKNTTFKNADLRKANLYNTNITQQQLNDTLSYACAILPDGTVYDNNGKEIC
jgi:uncharacterized protein YjbI with pentapeptide repeats